jgi:hypothetical protein
MLSINHKKHDGGRVMENIIIDEEFKDLLPALDKETYALLEENILQNGCRDSLVLWGNILIDGHNRYDICTRHNIPFNTINKEFETREDVLIWIVSTQISRRNLRPIQLSHFRGLLYRADKKLRGTYDRNAPKEHSVHSEPNDPLHATASRLSKQYQVSPMTIRRDAKTSEAIDAIGKASPAAKKKILSGEVSIDKKFLQGLSLKTEEEIVEIAGAIEAGTYEKPKSEASKPGEEAAGAANGQQPADGGAFAGAPDASVMTIRSLGEAVTRLTDSFYAELRRHENSADASEAKEALRNYISKLEKLYNQMLG